MAVRVELHKEQVRHVIQLTLNSMQRARKAAVNPAIALIIEKDIAEYTNAMNTMTEIK